MVFGQTVTVGMLVPGGILLAALLIFQILVGKRVIHFKGRRHIRIHTWSAYLMGFFALGHAFLALVFAYGWTVL